MSNDNFKNDHLDDVFKNVLKEEKKEKMNWEFESFMEQVQTKDVAEKSNQFIFKKSWIWSAAAILLLGFATWLLTDKNYTKTQLSTKKTDFKQKTNAIKENHPVEEEPVLIAKTAVAETPKQITKTTKKAQENPIINEHNPEYIVVNGQPIYDVELATKMTLESLSLLASNIDKSVSAMENIKHLNIKF